MSKAKPTRDELLRRPTTAYFATPTNHPTWRYRFGKYYTCTIPGHRMRWVLDGMRTHYCAVYSNGSVRKMSTPEGYDSTSGMHAYIILNGLLTTPKRRIK